jgi:hypothetical protein
VSGGTPAWLERLSICFAPSSNGTVDHKSKESADKIAAGGPWRVRDFLSFVQKTYQKGDVADVSQTCPIMSFAQKALGMCRADEALVQLKLKHPQPTLKPNGMEDHFRGSFLIRAKAWITPKLPVVPAIYVLLPS